MISFSIEFFLTIASYQFSKNDWICMYILYNATFSNFKVNFSVAEIDKKKLKKKHYENINI